MKGESVTNQTARVELVLQTQQVQGQRYILNPVYPDIRMQPRNVWFYKLSATVTTNRQQNGILQRPLVGKVRNSLRFDKVWPFFSVELIPLHTIVDIMEEPIELSVENIGDLQVQKLNFSGMLQIRDTAWRMVNNLVLNNTYLTPDGLFTYLTPQGDQYLQPA